MPSAPSQFPKAPDYPPRPERKLTYNEECAKLGGRSYLSARMRAPRTVTLPAKLSTQGGGRGKAFPQKVD